VQSAADVVARPTELAIRPLFHQLEKRVKAHVLVAFLGYALRVTLNHLLKRSASEYSPAEAPQVFIDLAQRRYRIAYDR